MVLEPCHITDLYEQNDGVVLKTVFDRASRLSSNWCYFSKGCDRLKLLFSRLQYLSKLVNTTISRFVAAVRVVVPLKDKSPADIVRVHL